MGRRGLLCEPFGIAATDADTLDRLWRCEEKYNEGDDPWYPDRDSLRYCFYTKLPVNLSDE